VRRAPPPELRSAFEMAGRAMARARRLLDHYTANPPRCPECGGNATDAKAKGTKVIATCANGHAWTMRDEDVIG